MEGYVEQLHCYEGVHRLVFRAGEGPGVVVIHEVPGITPEVARFGLRVADAGFTVFMPSLFGEPGRPFGARYVGSQLARACINRELRVLTRRGSSPITAWLRALCRAAHGELGGVGVGVVGMCLTGNFALTLMADESVMAPVLSQPSLPFPITPSRRGALQMTEAELAAAQRRVQEEGLRVLGLRFTHDVMCPAARFERLREVLGDGFEGIEINSGPGNPHKIPPIAHSVLTRDFVDESGHPTRAALERVLSFLGQHLRGT
jgi:dienelactone hydrolase